MTAVQTAVLQGEVNATKAAQHEMDDIDVKIGRMNAAAKNEQAQAVQNCKDAEKCQQEARAARVLHYIPFKEFSTFKDYGTSRLLT